MSLIKGLLSKVFGGGGWKKPSKGPKLRVDIKPVPEGPDPEFSEIGEVRVVARGHETKNEPAVTSEPEPGVK